MFVGGALHAVPTAVGRHDRADAGLDGRDVAGQVDAAQRRLVAARVALVQAGLGRRGGPSRRPCRRRRRSAWRRPGPRAGRTAGRPGSRGRPPRRVPRRAAGLRRSPRRSGPSARPAGTATHGAKTQLMPVARTSSAVTRSIFSTRSASRVQPRPMSCGKIDGAGDVVVPVDGVDAVEQRDGQARLERVLLVAVDQVGPALERVIVLVLGAGTAAAQQRTEEILLDVGPDLSAIPDRAASSGRSSRPASSLRAVLSPGRRSR